MPKLFVTRWRRKKKLFLSPVKDCFTQDLGLIKNLPVEISIVQIEETIPQTDEVPQSSLKKI